MVKNIWLTAGVLPVNSLQMSDVGCFTLPCAQLTEIRKDLFCDLLNYGSPKMTKTFQKSVFFVKRETTLL